MYRHTVALVYFKIAAVAASKVLAAVERAITSLNTGGGILSPHTISATCDTHCFPASRKVSLVVSYASKGVLGGVKFQLSSSASVFV